MNSATERLRVLFVENSSEDLELILDELRRGGYEPVIDQVMTEQAMRVALQKNSWDLILCDHSLPQFNSSEALRVYKETGLEIPFVIISGTMEEESAAHLMNAGAHDYLSKNNLARLIPIIQRELRQVQLRLEYKHAEVIARENEAQLRQAQKMESVGQLAGGVAHDFNNILTIIQGHSSLILSSATMSPNDRDSAQQISIAAERAANLTRQLLTFSRRQIIQTKALDLNEVVNGVSQMLRRVLGEDIRLETNFTPDIPAIFADHGMVEQILINLAVNSRDAMPKGGHLLISTSAIVVDGTYVEQNPEASRGETICLAVTDTGCGIPEQNLARIFEPFFTTKGVGKGTGLGLATVYGIVKQHSGWIKVQSEMDKGTTFQIYFPGNRAKKVKPEIATESVMLRGGTETILLVEDESPVRYLVKEILNKLGYSILEAESGVAALKIWKHNREKIHLLLTDMVMPDGITGRELAEIVQFDRPEIKVIYTSGYNAEIVGKDFTLHDGLNFLQKPYPPKKLAKAVRDCLDENRVAA